MVGRSRLGSAWQQRCAVRTSQPAGVRSEVIAPGHTNGEAWRGPVRRTPGLGTGRHIEMRCRLSSEGTKAIEGIYRLMSNYSPSIWWKGEGGGV